MALLEILHYPDQRLRNIAHPVEAFDDSLSNFVDDMFETMYKAPGIGLAAIQVNDPRRVLVVDISEEKNDGMCFVNPEIVSSEGIEQMEEGCLSVPDVYEAVERAERITVRALNQHGEPFELTADGLLAVCIQHEIDHLDGKLFVDYLSRLKQDRIRKKADKQRRMAL